MKVGVFKNERWGVGGCVQPGGDCSLYSTMRVSTEFKNEEWGCAACVQE